jgi:hypothetical protein
MDEREQELELTYALMEMLAEIEDCAHILVQRMILDRLEEPVTRVQTFEEAGLLTRNAGLVVRLSDGREFEITVVLRR